MEEIEVGDPARLPDKVHVTAWNGTAPIDASSGNQVHHRLSRSGDRQINRALQIMALVQFDHRSSEGRAYYDRKVAAGKHRWKPCAASKAGSGTSWHPGVARRQGPELHRDGAGRPAA